MSSLGWQREVILQKVADWLDQTTSEIDGLELSAAKADLREAGLGGADASSLPSRAPSLAGESQVRRRQAGRMWATRQIQGGKAPPRLHRTP